LILLTEGSTVYDADEWRSGCGIVDQSNTILDAGLCMLQTPKEYNDEHHKQGKQKDTRKVVFSVS
jgi:hypothetical protein